MSQQLKVRKRYSDETLQHAIDMVKSGSMSLRRAALAFQIPKSSLSNKVNDKTQVGCKPGPSSVLSEVEEQYIATWAIHMAKIGFGRNRNELLDTVKQILDAEGRTTQFKDNRPGKDWFYGFLRRHPEISERAPQQLIKERAIITPAKVEKWFKDFSNFMAEEVKDPSLWMDPSRWFNADESGFPLCPKSGKVLAPRGVPNVYNFTSSDKTQVTVLACMSAAGYYPKPLIVYPGKRFATNPLEGFPEAVMGRTENGWMDSELFVTWLRDVFVPALDDRAIKRPVVLFVDGHSTHSTLSASKFCREQEIILYCLLEHASHLMQPCDLKLFSSLKESWKSAVRAYQISNIGEYVTKAKFASVFKTAWIKSTTIEIATKGFRDSGLFPLDSRKVLGTSKMEPSQVFSSKPVPTSASVPAVSTATLSPVSNGIPSDVPAPPEKETETDQNYNIVDITLQQSQSTAESDVNPDKLQTAGASDRIQDEKVSESFRAILKTPSTTQKTKSKSERIALPKAISGQKFHDLLMEKQQKKEEEIRAKEQRKREREERKQKKEEEKERKRKEREEKREQRMKENELKKKLKMTKKVQKRKHSSSDSDTDSSEEVAYDDDALQDVDVDIKDTKCYACGVDFDGEYENWVSCHNCPRWLHRACVSTIDLISMSESELADLQFECDYC
ncbi:uncharacterized protein LOC132735898 [Ruditapes philippinarum]|uniref:uncharacterized protein LOC132735898 n=1 Tax=Ruditapes philippinarum TaxID=129788 RepID=UPI00295B0891|nr:uncharacterized protein LOC132735898 [Ruditapes philippinarum]